MIWLTWRQHRLQVAIGGLSLVLLCAALLAMKGSVGTYAHMVATCATPELCTEARDALAHYVGTSPLLQYVLPALPLLLGSFVGAPLVTRELEQGTHLLVWTQRITRRRWLAVKMAALASAAVLLMTALDALLIWWGGPIDAAIGPWATFDVRGATPLAYALFAFTLGVAAGIVVRHTVEAMALTLGGIVAVRLAVALGLRPRFLSPLAVVEPFHLGPDIRARDWVLGAYPVDHLGQPLRQYMQIVGACDAVARNSYAACLRDHGVFLRTIYQPDGRFWLFQGIESAIFLGLSAGLLALTFGRIALASD